MTTREAEAAAHGTSLAAGDRMSMLLVYLISVISHARLFSERLLEIRLAMPHHKQCLLLLGFAVQGLLEASEARVDNAG